MEVIAFAIGLDPILTRGQQLVDQYRTWKDNRQHAPKLSDAFTSFETELATCITRLQEEIAALPPNSRTLIENDVTSLTSYLTSAREILRNVNRRLDRNRVLQFFRANAVSKECDTLATLLREAQKLLRDANKHVDLRLAIQERSPSQNLVDSFRRYYPPGISSSMQAVLDFDSRDNDDNPVTCEGRVKKHLLDARTGDARVVSIHGMGGVGKSTVVHALSVDEDIRRYYRDGIYVLKLGHDATKASLFDEICEALKTSGGERTEQSLRTRNNIDEALRRFESWFGEKKCAVLIDDAWVHEIGIGVFSRLCKMGNTNEGSTVLITTREYEIGALAPSSKIIHMEPREARGRESRNMLFFHAECQETSYHADYDDNDDDEDGIKTILDICAGLPVNLAAAGRGVKKIRMDMPGGKEQAWKRYKSQLKICRDNLLRKNVNNYINLYVTFATSLTVLDKKPREERLGFPTKLSFAEMHRRLCVTQKQAVVPCTMLRHLWSVKSEGHAEIIARAFIEIGLANEKALQIGSEEVWHLTLHDSLHDFAVAEAKRHGEEKQVHGSLLSGYKSCDPELCLACGGKTKWWCDRLSYDGYIHGNVCRHLLKARLGTELVDLLMTPEWTAKQLEMNGILVLKADFSFGMEAIRDGIVDDIGGRPCDLEENLRLISEAITLSWPYVAKNRRELWFQICGRLVRLGNESQGIRKYLGRMCKKAERPWVRAVNSLLGEPGGVNMSIIPLGDWILCMTVVEDGERVLCGSLGGRIVVVNVIRGEIENEWKAHEYAVSDVANGKQGRRVVSASLDGTAKVWDFESHDCLTMFAGHSNVVTCVTVMEDGQRVVTGSRDGTAQVWDIDTGRNVCEPFRSHASSVECVTSLMDGEHVVTGGGDEKLRIWNAKSGVQVGEPFIGHKCWVSCVVVTPDGRRIVSGSEDQTIRIWDMKTHKQIGESLEGHTDKVRDVAVSKDGTRILSCSDEKMIQLWDMETGRNVCHSLKDHAFSVTGVSFWSNSYSIISCSDDRTIRVWDARRKDTHKVTYRHEDVVTCMSFTPDGNVVVTGSVDSTLRIWDVRSGVQVADPLQTHSDSVRGVAVTGDGSRIVSASEDGTICLWNLESRELLHKFSDWTDDIYCATVTSNPEHLVTGCFDGRIRVWDLVAMNGSHFVLEGHRGPVWRVFVSDDEKRVISVDNNGETMVWELETRQCIKNIQRANARDLSREQVMDLVDEDTVYDDANLSISLWSLEIRYRKGEDSEVLGTVESPVWSWALSPDRKTLCVGLENGQVCFMKLET